MDTDKGTMCTDGVGFLSVMIRGYLCVSVGKRWITDGFYIRVNWCHSWLRKV
ncbi:MAG: hypothetical protein IPL26_12620 [Leptospiraceae bacterium]|nr:hypothetical protein [Leptospiraceae bacterium]